MLSRVCPPNILHMNNIVQWGRATADSEFRGVWRRVHRAKYHFLKQCFRLPSKWFRFEAFYSIIFSFTLQRHFGAFLSMRKRTNKRINLIDFPPIWWWTRGKKQVGKFVPNFMLINDNGGNDGWWPELLKLDTVNTRSFCLLFALSLPPIWSESEAKWAQKNEAASNQLAVFPTNIKDWMAGTSSHNWS